MFPQDVIMKKRDGLALTQAEIIYFIQGVVQGYFQDYQSTALLMAILLNGMTDEETSWITEAMMKSGEVMNLQHIPKPKVDKHSTGGVGDKVSLILAPLAAACGLCVPMISGRGLGHTGGTLDKLQSIPGFCTDLSQDEFKQQLEKIGVSMIGQTSNIAPADKKLYALRDVTGTVESIPLICASIMSKKLAEGIDGLVLDVKFGQGAFMKSFEKAKDLAQHMVAIGKHTHCPTVAFLTDMNQPLGKAVGNSLEMIESFECLKNKGPEDLMHITIELTAQMVVLGKLASDMDQARTLVLQRLQSGAALAKMREIIQAQRGNPDVLDNYKLLPMSHHHQDFTSPVAGYVHEVHALPIGVAAMILGAGRQSIKDTIAPGVGICHLVKIGDQVKANDPLCRIHYDDEHKKIEAWDLLKNAFVIRPEPCSKPKIIQEILS